MKWSAERPIEARAGFTELRYANCWEDAEVVATALAPLDGARCVSVASAGDNTLSLVARGAAHVTAVDVSSAQLALLELKMAGFRALHHEELLGFLGVRPCRDRLAIFRALRPLLGPAARAFWDARPATLAAGVVHVGRLERYFAAFRRYVLPLVHRRETVARLFSFHDAEAQRRFCDEVWDSRRWRLALRLFFGRWAMGVGRHREFLRYADAPIGASVVVRAHRALRSLPALRNPYLRYILTGEFGSSLPDYLEARHHDAIRQGVERVAIHAGSVETLLPQLAPRSIDAFNLSDVAEYMHPDRHLALLDGVRCAAAQGARVASWNLFAKRQRPEALSEALEPRLERALRLHRQARTFFYGAFVLEVAR